jgi:hypothetical protein
MAKILLVLVTAWFLVWSFLLARRARKKDLTGMGPATRVFHRRFVPLAPLVAILVVVTALAALQGAGALAGAMSVTLGVVVLTFVAEWVAERRRTV